MSNAPRNVDNQSGLQPRTVVIAFAVVGLISPALGIGAAVIWVAFRPEPNTPSQIAQSANTPQQNDLSELAATQSLPDTTAASPTEQIPPELPLPTDAPPSLESLFSRESLGLSKRSWEFLEHHRTAGNLSIEDMVGGAVLVEKSAAEYRAAPIRHRLALGLMMGANLYGDMPADKAVQCTDLLIRVLEDVRSEPSLDDQTTTRELLYKSHLAVLVSLPSNRIKVETLREKYDDGYYKLYARLTNLSDVKVSPYVNAELYDSADRLLGIASLHAELAPGESKATQAFAEIVGKVAKIRYAIDIVFGTDAHFTVLQAP